MLACRNLQVPSSVLDRTSKRIWNPYRSKRPPSSAMRSPWMPVASAPAAPAAFRVRVWAVMSRGCGPRVGCPPPESVDAAYPPVHKHFFLTQNRLPAKHPKEGDPCSQLTRMFLTGCGDRGHTSRSGTQRCRYPKQGPTYDFRFRSHATAQTKTHPVLEPH